MDLVYPKEPWHIRYFAGDHVPSAVLDYERINPPEEEDMPLTDADILKVAQAVTIALEPQLATLTAKVASAQTNLAALQRRVLGVEVMADKAEQPKADADTGARFQRLLGG